MFLHAATVSMSSTCFIYVISSSFFSLAKSACACSSSILRRVLSSSSTFAGAESAVTFSNLRCWISACKALFSCSDFRNRLAPFSASLLSLVVRLETFPTPNGAFDARWRLGLHKPLPF